MRMPYVLRKQNTTALIALVLFALLTSPLFANPTLIQYSAIEIDALTDTWQYTYDVTNLSLPDDHPIDAFAVIFPTSLYENPVITPLDLAKWDEMVLEPTFGYPQYDYDVWAELDVNSGIEKSTTVSGFTVTFKWLGSGIPGSQDYIVYDQSTFTELDAAQTILIPAPAAVTLTATGLLLLRLKRRKS